MDSELSYTCTETFQPFFPGSKYCQICSSSLLFYLLSWFKHHFTHGYVASDGMENYLFLKVQRFSNVMQIACTDGQCVTLFVMMYNSVWTSYTFRNLLHT